MLGSVLRFAANPKALKLIGPEFTQKAAKILAPAFGNEAGKITLGSLAKTAGPDALFGLLAASQTPGDAFDKGTAFLTSTLGGVTGGAALTTLTGGRLGQFGELVGGFGGDYLGQMTGDSIQRIKDKLVGGEGLSAFERMSTEQQKEFAEQIRAQMIAQYGLIPGTREQYAVIPSDIG